MTDQTDKKNVLWYKQHPPAEAKAINDFTGIRPQLFNLRDHPELNGKHIKIVKCDLSMGDLGPYVKIRGFIEQAPVTIITGAVDVVERMEAISDILASGQIVEGVLVLNGRAWFID